MNSKWKLSGLLVVASLGLAGLACAVPSVGKSDGALLKDDFSDSNSGWGTGTDSDSAVEYQAGGLQVEVFKDNYFTWSPPNDTDYKNIHIEVTAANKSTDPDSSFGIICDQQVSDSAYYLFAIDTAGQYVISKAAVAKDDEILTNDGQWAPSDLIAADAKSYRLGADCGNGTLTLYVDGKKVDSVTDSTYTSGKFALFAWSGQETSATKVVFDDVAVTALK